MCQNSFHSIFPFTSSLLWKQEIRAAAWGGMQATTVNIVKWLHKTLSKIWNSFKEFQVCIQMFNPWKKKTVRKKVSDLESIADLGTGLRTELSIVYNCHRHPILPVWSMCLMYYRRQQGDKTIIASNSKSQCQADAVLCQGTFSFL